MHLTDELCGAHRNRVPVLAIASRARTDEMGNQYFQENRPTELFRDCTVSCEMVLSPGEIAMRTAIEQRVWAYQ